MLQGLIELRKVGVFASAVIKKRRYWPKYVPGDLMDDHMKEKELGATDSIRGKFDSVDYDLFMTKDSDFVMKLMSTYGSLSVPSHQKETQRYSKDPNGLTTINSFKYTVPFANHYRFRHAVDDHNNLRQSSPAIEKTWNTTRWANCVFQFILAISELNTYRAFVYFVWPPSSTTPTVMTHHEFHRKLSIALIHNEYLLNESAVETPPKRVKRSRQVFHEDMHILQSAPVHAKKYFNRKWDLSATSRYQQYTCTMKGCSKQTRFFCKCSPGVWICRECHPVHITSEIINNTEIH